MHVHPVQAGGKACNKKRVGGLYLGYKYRYGLVLTTLDLQEYIPYTTYSKSYSLNHNNTYHIRILQTTLDPPVWKPASGPHRLCFLDGPSLAKLEAAGR